MFGWMGSEIEGGDEKMKALHEVFAKDIGEEDWYPVGLPGVEIGTRPR